MEIGMFDGTSVRVLHKLNTTFVVFLVTSLLKKHQNKKTKKLMMQ